MARISLPVLPQSIGELLPLKLGADYIGASSVRIRGWSSISNYMKCDRMFWYRAVKKYRQQKSSDALDIGILIHECLAAHYSSGGQRTFLPLEAVQAERPEIAQEVKRLLYAYFAAYQKEDAETFDVRAVEQEIIGEVEHDGVKAPAYARLDLLIRRKRQDQEPLPFGPCPDGVWIIDHKCMARMSQDLLDGYLMDGQFLLMAYLWKKQKLDDYYGKLNGFIMNIITKTKSPELKRLQISISDRDIERFAKTMSPIIVEMHQRLDNPEERNNQEKWPMNFGICKSPSGYGPCEYLTLCTSHGEMAGLYEAPKK